MRHGLGLTTSGLRLTGRAKAIGNPPRPPAASWALLVTESGDRLVTELGHMLGIKENTP